VTGRPVRDLAIGIGAGMGSIALVFFGSAAAVEIATLVATVATAIWFSTTSVDRLVVAPGRPSLMLFGLAGMGVALVVTAAIFLSSLTVYLATVVAVVGVAVGLARGIGQPSVPPGREE
jgi:hypothetical protein